MNRREWIKSVVAAVIYSQVPVGLCSEVVPISLYGILYHQSNACTGTWLGFSREYRPTDKAS